MELRSHSKRTGLTALNTEKPNSPLTTEGSLKGDKIFLSQELTQLKEVVVSQPSTLFDIAAKEMSSSNDGHSLGTTPVSSMVSKRKAEVSEFKLRNEDMILVDLNTSTSNHPALSNTLLCPSAFKIIKSNEERLNYLYTKICEKNWMNKPPINSSIEHKVSLKQLISPVEDSSESKSLSESIRRTNVPYRGFKRSAPEAEIFQCKHCALIFETGQALGGHMSRKHSGKSLKYNHKKDVRVKREYERMKLHVAKKMYFENVGYDYEEMMQSVEGKMRAKSLINRSQIKKIKATLTEREVYANFK
jgi:hypothetical protein